MVESAWPLVGGTNDAECSRDISHAMHSDEIMQALQELESELVGYPRRRRYVEGDRTRGGESQDEKPGNMDNCSCGGQ
jgi:hypothetical protein